MPAKKKPQKKVKKVMPAKKTATSKKKQPNKLLKLFKNRTVIFVVLFALIGGVVFLYSSYAATAVACRDKQYSIKTGKSDPECVKKLQLALTNLYYLGRPATGSLDAAIDGNFGPNTEAAVKALQKASGIKVDGIVGPNTIASLCADSVNAYGANGSKEDFCISGSTPVQNQTTSSPAVTSLIQQFTSPDGKTQIGNSFINIVNSNSQVTNTGGKVEIGNSGTSTSTVNTSQITSALSNLANNITTNSNTNVVSNVSHQVDNTGGQIVIGAPSSTTGCRAITLTDPFSGVSKTYNSCNTTTPAATNITSGGTVSNGSATSSNSSTTTTTNNSGTNTNTNSSSNTGTSTSDNTQTPVTPPTIPVLTGSLSSNPCTDLATLSQGATGDCVKHLQDLLNIRSGAGLPVSGVFDLRTKLALLAYQIFNRLSASGIVDPSTWALLEGSHSTPNPSSCGAEGTIIVMFKPGTTRAQAEQIISQEKATVKSYYESLNGYALTVTKGKEQKFVDAFRKHTQVASASLDGCMTITDPEVTLTPEPTNPTTDDTSTDTATDATPPATDNISTPTDTPTTQETAPTDAPATLPAGTNCANTILKIGSTDTDCIKEAQEKLNAKGFNTQGIDGVYSEKTEAAVKSLRKEYTIVPCSSGNVDKYVWNVLNGNPSDPYNSCSDPIQTPTPDNPPSTSPTTDTTDDTPAADTTDDDTMAPTNDTTSGSTNTTDTTTPTSGSSVTTPTVKKPSAAFDIDSDAKAFTYKGKGIGLRFVRVCVAVAPALANQTVPNSVKTTDNRKINLISFPLIVRKAKVGCTVDLFSAKKTSASYQVDLKGYWVSVYGVKLN